MFAFDFVFLCFDVKGRSVAGVRFNDIVRERIFDNLLVFEVEFFAFGDVPTEHRE